MGRIVVSVETDPVVTVFTIEGPVTAEDVLSHYKGFLANAPTSLALWDFSAGSLSAIPNTLMRLITNEGARAAVRRPGARTAFVCPTSTDFATVSMFISLAEMTEYPVKMSVFHEMASARAWLLGRQDR